MKYENFDKVKSIVDTINKKTNLFNELKCNDLVIRIYTPGNYVITTIGASSSSEHEFRDEAVKFIDQLKKEIQADLQTLHYELSLL